MYRPIDAAVLTDPDDEVEREARELLATLRVPSRATLAAVIATQDAADEEAEYRAAIAALAARGTRTIAR